MCFNYNIQIYGETTSKKNVVININTLKTSNMQSINDIGFNNSINKLSTT
jgi:hypothetical protein